MYFELDYAKFLINGPLLLSINAYIFVHFPHQVIDDYQVGERYKFLWALVCMAMVIVFNATFNNISVISWRWLLLVEETGSTWRKPSTDILYRIMLYRVHLAMSGIRTHHIVMICTDCIGSCKSNYHTIATTMIIWVSFSFILLKSLLFVIQLLMTIKHKL